MRPYILINLLYHPGKASLHLRMEMDLRFVDDDHAVLEIIAVHGENHGQERLLSITQFSEIDIFAELIHQGEGKETISISYRQCPIEIFLDDECQTGIEFGFLQFLRIIGYVLFAHLQGRVIGDDVPDLFCAEIESDIRMVVRGIFVSHETVPSMRIYGIGDMFQASVGPYECDTVLEREQGLFFGFPFEFVVDIDADLDKLESSQAQKGEFPFFGESFFIDDDFFGLDVKRAFHDKSAGDGLDLFTRECGILDIQGAVFFDERIQKLCMLGDIVHRIIIMLGKSELDYRLRRFIRGSEMLMESFYPLFVGLDHGSHLFWCRNELLVVDIIIHESDAQDLLEDMQESALAGSVGSDEHVHVVIFPIIKFNAFDLGKIGLIRIAQKV